MTKPKKKAVRKDNSYLVATFPNFPGVEIPLLSKEECQARGIERGRLRPPILGAKSSKRPDTNSAYSCTKWPQARHSAPFQRH